MSKYNNYDFACIDLELILTQKCNFSCEHCMRGNCTNKEISEFAIENIQARTRGNILSSISQVEDAVVINNGTIVAESEYGAAIGGGGTRSVNTGHAGGKGVVTINGGNYTNDPDTVSGSDEDHVDLIYASNGSEIIITGGIGNIPGFDKVCKQIFKDKTVVKPIDKIGK